jgi:hypothetical protein
MNLAETGQTNISGASLIASILSSCPRSVQPACSSLVSGLLGHFALAKGEDAWSFKIMVMSALSKRILLSSRMPRNLVP